ncbi:hypothetical protein D3C80_633790 [compost metagenome]
MSESINSSTGPSSSIFCGLPVSALDWNAALAHAEELALAKGHPETIAFLDDAQLLGALFRSARGTMSKRHMFLPAGGAFQHILMKFFHRRPQLDVRFSPDSFIPALLTYFAEPRRIGLIGDDKSRTELLCAHFARHTPWHDFVAISFDANPSGRLDLVIVDATDRHVYEHIAGGLRGADIGLVVLAGRGLRRFAKTPPVSSGLRSSVSKPSFA